MNISSGTPWESRVGYSRAVRRGQHVWVSGTTATGEGGELVGVGDAYEQTKQALANISSALQRANARLDEIVRTRIYVTDIERDWEAIGRAHAELLGNIRPATTMVEVARLIHPEMLVEVEVDVFSDDHRDR